MTITRVINSVSSANQLSVQQTSTNTNNPDTPSVATTSQGGLCQYNGTSGPIASKAYAQLITLTAGAATLDLTALVDGGVTIDMTGLHLLEIFAIADTANANPLTIAPGASNGYTGWVGSSGLLLKTANDANKLGPMYGGIAVDGTHKTIDFAGTGSQKVSIVLLFG